MQRSVKSGKPLLDQNWEPQPLREMEKQEWVRDFMRGAICCHLHFPDLQILTQVFIPLGQGVLQQLGPNAKKGIGLMWQYVRNSGPFLRAGVPVFQSITFMHKDDWADIKVRLRFQYASRNLHPPFPLLD